MAIPLDESTLEAIRALVAATAVEGDLRGLDYFTVQQAARFCGLKESAFRERADALGIPLIVPRPALCTDNGAMIGAAGARRFAAGERAGLDLDARPSLPLATR